jgi:hypothetical protein
MKKIALLILVFVLLSTMTASTQADYATLYVKPNGTKTGSCSNWSVACDLQYAISIAQYGDDILVYAGTYYPTSGTDRTATFQLKDGVDIIGESGGSGASILSGAIGTASDTDNSYHVVTGSGVDHTAKLEGFTVSDGYADGTAPHDRGAGIYISHGFPHLKELKIENNQADFGGGVYNNYGSSFFENVYFYNNDAEYDGACMYNTHSDPFIDDSYFQYCRAGRYGGAAFNYYSDAFFEDTVITYSSSDNDGGGMYNSFSSPTIQRVHINENQADDDGGGLYNNGASSQPEIIDSSIRKNIAGGDGGGMYNFSATPTLTNVTLYRNQANSSSGSGGGIYNYSADAVLTHVTISENSANMGGGIYNKSSNAIIRNTLLWDNTANSSSEIYNDSSTPTVSDCVIEGGYAGGTNIITADPELGSMKTYYSSSAELIYLPLSSETSSAVDVADDSYCPFTDQKGTRRLQNTQCDIGAIEYMVDNDEYDSAEMISSLSFSDEVNTVYSTAVSGDPAINACDIYLLGEATVWYEYTPSTDTAISIDTLASNYDTFIAVWTKSGDDFELVACNDNGAGQAVLALQVERDTTYYIEIGQP